MIKKFIEAFIVSLLAASMIASAPSSAANSTAEQAARATVASLKEAAFENLRDLYARELQTDYPTRTRTSLYVGIPASNFKLQQLSVSFDGEPESSITYTAQQIRALERGYLHRVARTNLSPGKHRVVVKYAGVLPRPLLGDKPVSEEIILDFEKTTEAKRLIVPVVPDLFGLKFFVDPEQWRQQQQAQDPRLGMARFLRATGKEYAALTTLFEIAGARNQSDVLPLAYDLELAHSYVDFGMREEADKALRVALDSGVDLRVLAGAWLRIADLDLSRGDASRAYDLLQFVQDDLTPEQLVHWQDVYSRLLMADGQYEQAAKILEMGDNATEVLTDVELPTNQSVYMRFNYAVSLLKIGETARGRTLLERIGRVTAFGEDQRALRDKANLMLGYNFLAEQQGATGKHILERIRIDGPYSNEALLALGWSELAPEGSRQPRALVGDEPELGDYGSRNPEAGRIIKEDAPVRLRDDPFSRVQLGPFRMAHIESNKRSARLRALVAWEQVASQSPHDPAVQEALIAMPYATQAAGWPSRAMQQYLDAIEILELSRAELNGYAKASHVDLAAIAQGDLDALPDTPWMLQLLAGQDFHEHLDNYLVLGRLYTDLRRLSTHGSQGLSLHLSPEPEADDRAQAKRLATLRAGLRAASVTQARLAQQVVADEIKKQRQRLDKYLVAARLGVARFQEKQLAGEGKPQPKKKDSGFSLWPW